MATVRACPSRCACSHHGEVARNNLCKQTPSCRQICALLLSSTTLLAGQTQAIEQ